MSQPEERRCRNTACGKTRQRRASQPGHEGACGYCGPCYGRWARAGYPDAGPPPLRPPPPMRELSAIANARRAEEREDRKTDFAIWRRAGKGVGRAAFEVGVSKATGYRYEAELRRQRENDYLAVA
jgi:hypothetical protein